MSWNIQLGIDVLNAIIALEELRELRSASIIFLQEMDRAGSQQIANALGYHHIYEPAAVHYKTGREFGNAVLSRRPLSNVEVVPLPHRASVQGQPRIALWASTTLGGATVEVASVHTETPSLSMRKRVQQFEAIAGAAASRSRGPVLVGGDFNTASSRAVKALTEIMAGAGTEHLSPTSGWTLQRGGKRFTLDHLFGRGFVGRDSGVVRQLPVSDHAPLWVTLNLEE
ncbi:MAG: hypothetical protein GY724_30300 [Actinomycetia bacterium]|nr:hypothetical protein [Actinomycetes bacterium]